MSKKKDLDDRLEKMPREVLTRKGRQKWRAYIVHQAMHASPTEAASLRVALSAINAIEKEEREENQAKRDRKGLAAQKKIIANQEKASGATDIVRSNDQPAPPMAGHRPPN